MRFGFFERVSKEGAPGRELSILQSSAPFSAALDHESQGIGCALQTRLNRQRGTLGAPGARVGRTVGFRSCCDTVSESCLADAVDAKFVGRRNIACPHIPEGRPA